MKKKHSLYEHHKIHPDPNICSIPENTEINKFPKTTADFEKEKEHLKLSKIEEEFQALSKQQPNKSPTIKEGCFSRLCKLVTQSR